MKNLFIKLSFCLLSFLAVKQSQSQTWNYDFGDSLWIYEPGYYNSAIGYKIYSYNNKLFVYGAYNRIGTDTAAGFAYWNGYSWKPIVNSWWTSGIKDMKYYDNNLYVCGNFQQINNIENLSKLAKWDGTAWDFVSQSSINVNSFYSMQWLRDTLFLSGLLGYIDGVYRNYVVQWDGANWLDMEQGIDGALSDVYCSAVYNGQIHVGGHFTSASGHPAEAVARWDGQQWNAIGTGLYGQVQAMTVDTITNILYVSGYLAVPGDTLNRVGNVAKWDGQQWTCLMDSTDDNAISICTYRGNVFAGGPFTYINDKPIRYLARWNGVTWDSIASGIGMGRSMTVFNDELIVGGVFLKFNGLNVHGFARYYEPPDSACLYFSPAIYTDADTFYLQNDTVSVQFFNNNSHANTWAWNFGDTGTDTVWCPVHVYNQPGTFTVNVNVTELWCNKSAQKTVVISDLLNSQQPIANSLHPTALKIYPNPATGSITIEITGAAVPFLSGQLPSGIKGNGGSAGSEGNSELRITNQQGKLIKAIQIKEPNSKTEINTKGWAKGTYLCSLLVKGKTVKVEKLVIE